MLQPLVALSTCQLYHTLRMALRNQFTSPFPPMENTDNNMDLHSACKKHLAYLTYRVPSMRYHYSESHTQIHPLETIAGHLAEPVGPRCQRSDRPMRASPPHITVGKQASRLGWDLKSCCVVF